MQIYLFADWTSKKGKCIYWAVKKFLFLFKPFEFVLNASLQPEIMQRSSTSSRSQMFFKIGVLKDFANFAENLCIEIFFFFFFLKKKSCRPQTTLLKKDTSTQVSSCEICKNLFKNHNKFLKIPFFTEHLWCLLLILFSSNNNHSTIKVVFLFAVLCPPTHSAETHNRRRKNVNN